MTFCIIEVFPYDTIALSYIACVHSSSVSGIFSACELEASALLSAFELSALFPQPAKAAPHIAALTSTASNFFVSIICTFLVYDNEIGFIPHITQKVRTKPYFLVISI